MSKRVTLSKPIRGADGQMIQSIALREPRYGDYMDLGLPVQWVTVNPDGGGFEQETPGLVRAWIEKLLPVDFDPNYLEPLTLADSLALRDAVLDFFREARSLRPRSTDSPAPSSSPGAGTLEPSTI